MNERTPAEAASDQAVDDGSPAAENGRSSSRPEHGDHGAATATDPAAPVEAESEHGAEPVVEPEVVGAAPVEPEAVEPEADEPDTDGLAAAEDDERARTIQKWVSWAFVGACSIFVFWSLHPQLLLLNTTPTGGDMGAHVWGPRFLADHLLPDFRLTGWTQDWYAGFPAYVFYMVVPSLFIVWLNAGPPIWLSPVLLIALAAVVRWALQRVSAGWARRLVWGAAIALAVLAVPIPYNIAFKLVTVSGLVTLPIAAYALARAARVPFPGPPIAALAVLPFIYDKSFTILGGNGASTMAGEFAFSISLTFGLLYLAVVFRGIRTGRDRALGAALLALTILCHLIPAIFVGIASLILLFVRREDRVPWWDRSLVGRLVAACLVIFTLLILVPSVELPFGLQVGSPLPEWWFPAVATAVAIALLTGFEPRMVRWWTTKAGLLVGAALLVGLGALLVLRPAWWTVAVIGIVLAVAFFAGWDTRLARWLVLAAPAGILLTGFWSVPFLSNSTYMNDMGWEKYTDYRDYLLSVSSLDSGGMPYRNAVFALAGLGVLLALIHRIRFGWFLTMTVAVFAWTFRFFPQYRLWNARLLPFYYLCLYLLAGLGLALAIRSVAIAVADLRRRRTEPVGMSIAGLSVVALVVGVVLLASFRSLPGGQQVTDPETSRSMYRWAGMDFETGIVPDWARWNYEGLERKAAWPELEGIVNTMRRVSDEHGCGRAMWEYEGDLQRFGTPMALMLLPYFTNGCVGSMEGLYFEASSTTPFHFLNQSALSQGPSRAQRDLPYTPFDIDLGVAQLQMLGVKYYMATTPAAIEAARGHEDLTEVAAETYVVPGSTDGVTEHDWVVFEVADSDLVTGLANDPVVLTDADDHIDGWVYAPERPEAVEGQPRPPKAPGPAVKWFQDPSRWDVLLATGGPEDWPRAPSTDTDPPHSENPEVTVSDIATTNDSVSFRVDRTGVPVLVRASYFPNWGVDGAEGPWRVSPNFMVVVPTDEEVTLSYGYTRSDLLGWLAALVGVAALAGLAVLDVRARRRSDELDDGTDESKPAEPALTDPS